MKPYKTKKTMRKILLIPLLLLSLAAQAQNERAKAAKIKADESYRTGEGYGKTLEEASKSAVEDLLSKISTNLRSSMKMNINEVNKNGDIDSESAMDLVINSYTQGTLRNSDELCLSGAPEFHVLRYVKQTEIDQIFAEREDRVKDYIRGALNAEKKGRIDNALRYYYWGYNLLKSVQSPASIKMDVGEGKQPFLLNWIPEQMRQILSHMGMSVATTDQETGEVELLVTYEGKPVTSIDFSYFDGVQWSAPTSAKDGMAQIDMRPGVPVTSIQVKYEYAYEKQARQDAELEMVMSALNGFNLNEAQTTIKVGSKGAIKKVNKQLTEVIKEEATANNTAKATVQTDYTTAIEKIIAAIKSKNYGSVRELFTPEGFQMFDKLVHYGNATLIGTPNIQFYKVLDQVVCRSIPMKFTFRNNNRSFVEDLTLTFDSDNKIESLAFGLDQSAKDDIFNKGVGKWNDDVRMIVAAFLENYKTAFALKRLDYIENIFDDNAVIITGSYVKRARPNAENNRYINNENVKYNRQDKSTYLKNLEKSFNSNQFINIRFADNDISKMGTGGQLFGIQIRQDYYSSSYSDTGYLFLMVDLNDPKTPIIKVRTWQPERDPNINSTFERDSQFYGLFYGGNF